LATATELDPAQFASLVDFLKGRWPAR